MRRSGVRISYAPLAAARPTRFIIKSLRSERPVRLTLHALSWRRVATKWRQMWRFFSDPESAKKEAQFVAQQIQGGMQHVTDLKPHQRGRGIHHRDQRPVGAPQALQPRRDRIADACPRRPAGSRWLAISLRFAVPLRISIETKRGDAEIAKLDAEREYENRGFTASMLHEMLNAEGFLSLHLVEPTGSGKIVEKSR